MGYTIDTAATIHSLEAAGLQPEQALAIVNAISRSDEALATKAGVKTLEVDLKADLKALGARISMRLYTGAVGIVVLLLAAQLFASEILS